MPWEEPTAVQLRVALLEIEPAIWRQLVVPWGFHLGQLHRVDVPGGAVGTKLIPDMRPGPDKYFQPTDRDFIAAFARPSS